MKTPFDTPEAIRHQIWKELGRASLDRHHAWRTPVVASVGADGAVNARTVVLRSVDAATGRLQIYTDARSAKVAELALTPHAMLVFWSPRLGWQLRVRVAVTVCTTGPEVTAVWERVRQSPSAGDYLAAKAPGTPLAGDAMDAPAAPSAEVSERTPHLAVLDAQVQEIDWLELNREGHRRARITADDWTWLTP